MFNFSGYFLVRNLIPASRTPDSGYYQNPGGPGGGGFLVPTFYNGSNASAPHTSRTLLPHHYPGRPPSKLKIFFKWSKGHFGAPEGNQNFVVLKSLYILGCEAAVISSPSGNEILYFGLPSVNFPIYHLLFLKIIIAIPSILFFALFLANLITRKERKGKKLQVEFVLTSQDVLYRL